MTIFTVTLQHANLALGLALGTDLQLEELAPLVGDNVERLIRTPAPPWEIFWTNDPEPRAHAGEVIRDRFCIHNL